MRKIPSKKKKPKDHTFSEVTISRKVTIVIFVKNVYCKIVIKTMSLIFKHIMMFKLFSKEFKTLFRLILLKKVIKHCEVFIKSVTFSELFSALLSMLYFENCHTYMQLLNCK